jgi:hypothetical protein
MMNRENHDRSDTLYITIQPRVMNWRNQRQSEWKLSTETWEQRASILLTSSLSDSQIVHSRDSIQASAKTDNSTQNYLAKSGLSTAAISKLFGNFCSSLRDLQSSTTTSKN